MCLLTFLPAGILPDTGALLNGTVINDDGCGYAIVIGDRVQVRHGLDAEDMIARFEKERHGNPDGPALFHSRLATHGEATTGNCHPFPVGDDTRTVLAHNGILPAVVHPAKTDTRSDTRILAGMLTPTFGSMRMRRNRLRLKKWMTPANKIVILTVDRSFTRQAYILNEAAGIWDGDIWYSNDGYLPQQHPADWDFAQRDIGWELLSCASCGSRRDTDDAWCRICGCCCDCGDELQYCGCYVPARDRSNLPS